MAGLVPNRGNYRQLLCYRKAEAIYDITYHFVMHFVEHGDRTRDQMVQAARSGKQNIAEGYAAGATSKETELKLLNVAKSSLNELLEDYLDYLIERTDENNRAKIKDANGKDYEIYAIKADEGANTQIPVPSDSSDWNYSISGTNCGYYVVSVFKANND